MQASIAERITYGRPYDPVADDTLSPVVPRAGMALIGRILIASIFVTSGLAKFLDPAGAIAYMNSVGIPNADALVFVAGTAELGGGLLLIVGLFARLVAIGLVVLLVLIIYYFHNFWALPDPEAKMQMVQFFKNLGIMGGLAMVIAMGPGRYSIDARVRWPNAP